MAIASWIKVAIAGYRVYTSIKLAESSVSYQW